jgi:heme-degrading monooxygenase HmoA
VIARLWRGAVRTSDTEAYVAYVTATGLSGYRETAGNRGAWIWTRDLGDGLTEVVTYSLWTSLDDIRGFAGDDVEQAVFYDEDDAYLVERDPQVKHFDVVDPIGRA